MKEMSTRERQKLKGGRHIKLPEEKPIADLYLALLDMLGTPVDKFGNSDAKLNILSV